MAVLLGITDERHLVVGSGRSFETEKAEEHTEGLGPGTLFFKLLKITF